MALAVDKEDGMNRLQRWLCKDFMYRFTEEEGAVGEAVVKRNRRATDTITPDLIKQKANNGQSVKELVAEVSLKNDIDHAVIKTTLSFHNKFIWTCIGILITGVIGGFIALCYFAVRTLLGG